MKKRNIIALSILVIFYISYGIVLTLFQEKVVYFPNAQDFNKCAYFANAEKVDFKGTRMYVHDTDKPTVVLYHGNAGSACDRSVYADIFTQAGYGYIIVEYTGFSNEAATPTHAALKNNVQNVIAYITENKISDITVIGESIGTGIASYHTSLSVPNKLLLISPFTDLKDVAKNRFWFYPTSLLVNNAFDNLANLEKYHNPITIIHGTKDSIIPYKLGQKLFALLDTQKEFITITDAGHNDLFLFPETYEAITNFLLTI